MKNLNNDFLTKQDKDDLLKHMDKRFRQSVVVILLGSAVMALLMALL